MNLYQITQLSVVTNMAEEAWYHILFFCICLHQRLLPQMLMAIKPPWMTCVQKNVCKVQCKLMRYLSSPTTAGAPHLTRKGNLHPHALEL